jgi:hypothetical protein
MYINYVGTPTYEGFDALGDAVQVVKIVLYVVFGLLGIFALINSQYVETSQNYKNL